MFHTGQRWPVDLITDGVDVLELMCFSCRTKVLISKPLIHICLKSLPFFLSVLFCPGLDGEHCGPNLDVRVLIKKR